MTRLTTRVGQLQLKNPVICGAGEQTMTAPAIRRALATGAGAVVAKSTNESLAAKQQLDKTDYVLLDASWNRLPWNFAPPADASLFGRSGLVQRAFAEWLEELAVLDREARAQDAYVIPSLILSDLEQCADYARQIEQAGLRVLELNIGAPHGEEAAKGAIVLERGAQRIEAIVARIRQATTLPLWVKLTGQSEDVVGLAQAARRGGADSVVMMGRFMGFLPDLETGLPLLGTSAAIGGAWALPLTARWLMMTRKAMGDDYPLIATNGARNGLDVARFLLAGACATEMTSAVFTGGYEVLSRAVSELDEYVQRRGLSVEQLLGNAADQVQTYQQQPDRPDWWQRFAPECPGSPG
ncbi:dihydroorotate dehydrogenase [Pseudomonas extremaustralis]|uniref:dihydroorotate dehydrogenase n=1 Tax=Pseudomonas extremaustralis TaxID=359110 RepID=UPI002AA687DF|nr:dihydroorotate dehydrogenase [Pseudomonas extremaustralis]